MYAWEVVNEFHDWANECRLNPDQIIEVTRLACDVARDTAPKVKRLINNCAPFAEYVQLRKMTEHRRLLSPAHALPVRQAAERSRGQFRYHRDPDVFPVPRSVRYFPADREVRVDRQTDSTDRGRRFLGPLRRIHPLGQAHHHAEPYVWHRPWDEELQADWAEAVYTYAYSRPGSKPRTGTTSWIPMSGSRTAGFSGPPKGNASPPGIGSSV